MSYNRLASSAPSRPYPLLLDIGWYYYFCLLNHPPQVRYPSVNGSNPSSVPTVLLEPFTKSWEITWYLG